MNTETVKARMPKRVKQALASEVREPEATTPPVRIQECAVLLNVELSRLHVWRKVSTVKVQIERDDDGNETEKDALAVNKEILKCEELRQIMRLDDDVRRYLYAHCLPSPFKRGIYLLPMALVSEVMDRLAVYEARRADLVEAFLVVYEREKALAKKRLAALYDPKDYPATSTVRTLFVFTVQLMEMTVPGTLQSLKGELYRQECKKAEAMWAESKLQVTSTLYAEFVKLVERLSIKLKDKPTTGGRQIFRDSTVGNLQEWLRLFDARNLTDDQQLVQFVEEARSMIGGVDPATIRDSDSLRQSLASQFETLGDQLEARIEALPERAISFDN